MENEKVFKEDGSGTEQIHIVSIPCKRGSHTRYKYGATTSDGKVLIDPIHKNAEYINPFSDKRAVLLTYNKEGVYRPYTYTYATKKLEATEVLDIKANGSKDEVMVILGRGENRPPIRDAYLYSPFTQQPRKIKNIGGKGYAELFYYSAQSFQPIYRYGEVIIANYNTEVGIKTSQLLNLVGEPLTPMTNAIELLQFISPDTSLKNRTFHWQLTSKISEKVSDDFPMFKLYLPLNEKGEFIKLPKGVIGLGPTQYAGWFVFIETKNGVEATYFKTADLSSLNESVLKLPRFKRISPHRIRGYDQEFMLTQKTDGSWLFYDLFLDAPKKWPKDKQTYTTKEAVEKDFYAYIDSEYKKFLAAKEEEKLKAARSEIARKENLANSLANAASKNQLCWRLHEVIQVGQPYVDQYIANCPIYSSTDLTKLRQAGGNPNGLRNAENNYNQKLAREQQDAKAQEYRNNAYLNAMKAPVSIGPIANPGTPSQQQQNYRMERDVNRQIFNKSWDPYK